MLYKIQIPHRHKLLFLLVPRFVASTACVTDGVAFYAAGLLMLLATVLVTTVVVFIVLLSL